MRSKKGIAKGAGPAESRSYCSTTFTASCAPSPIKKWIANDDEGRKESLWIFPGRLLEGAGNVIKPRKLDERLIEPTAAHRRLHEEFGGINLRDKGEPH